MIVSMTAYGCGEYADDHGQISCEIRSVNHRYLEMSIRLPEELRPLEQDIRFRISNKIKRGKVDCTIRYEQGIFPNDNLPVNQYFLDKLIETVRKIDTLLQKPAAISPLELLRWPGVLKKDIPESEVIGTKIFKLVDETLEQLIATREREGEKLRTMIFERCQKTKTIVADVEKILPRIQDDLGEKLRQRMKDLCAELNNDRLEQELLLLAQKMDVTEEMDRLDAHVDEVCRVLDQKGPVGRRLDFLMQEMNREANTLGSKSAHLDTSNASVDLKVLIEQMREQIQNIE